MRDRARERRASGPPLPPLETAPNRHGVSRDCRAAASRSERPGEPARLEMRELQARIVDCLRAAQYEALPSPDAGFAWACRRSVGPSGVGNSLTFTTIAI